MSKHFVIIFTGILGCTSACSDTYEVLTTRQPDSGSANDAEPSIDLGDSGPPVEKPPVIPGISHLGAGAEHTCLLADGRIMCTGSGLYAALGTGDEVLTEFTLVDPRTDWVSLDTHRHTNCAMNQAREVWCWGHNDFGQANGSAAKTVPVPTRVDLPGPATQFSVGDRVSCAIVRSELYCWGGDVDSALLGDNTGAKFGPQLISLPQTPDSVEAGRSSVCIRLGTEVYCWGRNTNVMLSIDNRTPESAAQPVVEPTRVYETGEWVEARLATEHLCLRSTTGEVVCSGRNATRQISNRTIIVISNPTSTGLSGDTLAAGESNTCALDAGNLQCRGLNRDGQLNDVPTSSRDYRDVTAVGEGGYNLLAVGGDHICATQTGRVVHCWGRGDDGRLGADLAGPNHETVVSVIPAP